MLKYSRDKNYGTCRSGEGREEPATYVTADLSFDWEGPREKCEDNKWDEEKDKQTKQTNKTNKQTNKQTNKLGNFQ